MYTIYLSDGDGEAAADTAVAAEGTALLGATDHRAEADESTATAIRELHRTSVSTCWWELATSSSSYCTVFCTANTVYI